MAMYDWNGNGRNDRADDYMEYHIATSNSEKTPSYGGSSSGSGGLISVFSALFIESFIFTLLDIDVSDVPMILILLLWIVFSALFAYLVGKLKNM